MAHILIADDNKDITDILSAYVEKEGYVPVVAADGAEAVNMFNKYNPVLVLLDVMMPYKDGYQVCREIREKSEVPIILITARGEDFERIMGLDMARIRAILRRVNRGNSDDKNVLNISTLQINIEEYSLSISGKKIPLTKKEIETMWILAGNPNKVFTRDNLLDSLWGIDYYGDSRTVDSHIKRLRAKIDKVDHPEWSIRTIWGLGYKFELEGQD